MGPEIWARINEILPRIFRDIGGDTGFSKWIEFQPFYKNVKELGDHIRLYFVGTSRQKAFR